MVRFYWPPMTKKGLEIPCADSLVPELRERACAQPKMSQPYIDCDCSDGTNSASMTRIQLVWHEFS